jgi:hypothetical protein
MLPFHKYLLSGMASVWPLADDVSAHVFQSLDAHDLATAALVCRQWRSAARADALWWPHCAAFPGAGSVELEQAVLCEAPAHASSPAFSATGAWRAHTLFGALSLLTEHRVTERCVIARLLARFTRLAVRACGLWLLLLYPSHLFNLCGATRGRP